MKQENKLNERMKELVFTVIRFPLTGTALLAAMIINAFMINTQSNPLSKILITLFLCASLSVVMQMIYERINQRIILRLIGITVTIIVSIIYYFLIRDSDLGIKVTIKTSAFLFFLFITFLWVPSFKNEINFNHSVMAVFKAFFITIFFTGVIFIGTALILGATNLLIIEFSSKAYLHAANIIFILLAPIYFLSLIPFYAGVEDSNLKNTGDITDEVGRIASISSSSVNSSENSSESSLESSLEKGKQKNESEYVVKAISSTKFLESLVSYVVIPITVIFTIILLIYIVTNIAGSFWKDNLMEPMLVIYSIVVMIVYLLASGMENMFVRIFRKVFPKILIPVVLFQTISSILKIQDIGITYGRYYVILFGVFSTIAGILFCIVPIRRNGIIAPILMTLSIISIVPPIDAFSISRVNQVNRLETVLIKNKMLQNNKVTPDSNIAKEDRNIITGSINYLNLTGDIKNVIWLSDYAKSMNFKKTFGFEQYDIEDKTFDNIYFYRDLNHAISITGYDYYLRTGISPTNENNIISSFIIDGKEYQLLNNSKPNEQRDLVIKAPDDREIIRFPIQEVFSRYIGKGSISNLMSQDDATFSKENKEAIITIIVDSIHINQWEGGSDSSADVNILMKIK